MWPTGVIIVHTTLPWLVLSLLEQIHGEVIVQTHCVLCDAKVMHLGCLEFVVIHSEVTFGGNGHGRW